MTLVAAFVLCLPATAGAQDKGDKKPAKKATPAKKAKKGKKAKGEDKFDFTGLNLEGRLRTPQLLYFLDRAAEELERASLERRSFIPEMVKSIEEENL
jgi:hypothetical protein